jgi:UDP-N-acetylmuramoyl-tripeptide--D-alanyl-D-alanine ligase
MWTGERVARVLGTVTQSTVSFRSITTDTRCLQPGSLFVALVGERFDGHEFLRDARRRGALGAVVQHGTPPVDGMVHLEVDDTLTALGLLARERRRMVTGPVVAITGTNGKTSVKEMVRCALGTRWKVQATRENLNNLVGVPLTILAAPDDCEALVVEAGANLPGEIARLRDVIEPSLGVVTNVGAGHLAGFGSLDGVLVEKAALLEGVPKAVVGTEPPELGKRARSLAGAVVTAGLADSAAVRPDEWGLGASGHGWLVFEGIRIDLPVLGKHQLDNAMLMLATALELGLEVSSVRSALQNLELPSGRCEMISCNDRIILQDTYNANPGSLLALLDTARNIRDDRPLVVVLGTMLELGTESLALHAQMADAVMQEQPQLLAVLGEFIPAVARYAHRLGDRLITAEDSDSLGRLVATHLTGNEIVLVKGSHGVHMEHAIPHLTRSDNTPCSTIS